MRHRHHGLLLSLLTLLSLCLLGARSVAASPQATPVAVAPSECTVAPLTIDQLSALVSSARPIDAPWVDPLLTSKAVDAGTLTMITALVRESVACTNANDPMRNFALFTDRYLIERFGGEHQDDLGHLAASLTRNPAPAAPEDQLSLVSITDAVFLDARTVVATVTTANATTVFGDQLRFVSAGSEWRIDAVKLGQPRPTGPAATPAS